MLTPLPTIDNCAQEPIQTPGLIKPHGYFLACSNSFDITHYSENAIELFNIEELIKLPLSELMGTELIKALSDFFKKNPNEKYFIETLNGNYAGLSCMIHRTATGYIVEIEKSNVIKEQPTSILKSINRVLAVISESANLGQLFNNFATELKELLAIDRVMVYEFDKDWNGQVIAERKGESLEPFLNLHYPASDIPEQARALYKRNWLRIIPDVNYKPIRILPECGPLSDHPLDLSFSVLRSASPVHLQYLRNMGVQATLVMSLIIEDKLWGLIACHHSSPRHIEMEIRYLCEMFAKVISVNIQRLTQLKHNIELNKRLRDLSLINIKILKQWKLHEALLNGHPNIMDLVSCDGVATYYNNTLTTKGTTPSPNFVQKLTEWLDQSHKDDIFSTASLATEWKTETIPSSAVGIVSLRLGKAPCDYIIWFRGELIEEINWAGDPDKNVTIDTTTLQLSPRRSFATFKQQIKGKSRPWEEFEVEIVRNLRIHILEFLAFEKIRLETVVNEKTRQLATALQIVEQAKLTAEENLEFKSHMLTSMSHEIRTPLNGILGIAHVIKSKIDGADIRGYVDLIEKSGKRLLATLSSVLELAELEANKKQIKIGVCDLRPLVEEAISVLTPLAESKKLKLELQKFNGSASCFGDSNLISQIFYNIIGNAIKYTSDGSITITFSETMIKETVYASVTVEDTGIGISEEFLKKMFTPFSQESMGMSRKFEGVGLGLSLTKKYIDILGGHIEVESKKNKGSRFMVMLPKTN